MGLLVILSFGPLLSLAVGMLNAPAVSMSSWDHWIFWSPCQRSASALEVRVILYIRVATAIIRVATGVFAHTHAIPISWTSTGMLFDSGDSWPGCLMRRDFWLSGHWGLLLRVLEPLWRPASLQRDSVCLFHGACSYKELSKPPLCRFMIGQAPVG